MIKTGAVVPIIQTQSSFINQTKKESSPSNHTVTSRTNNVLKLRQTTQFKLKSTTTTGKGGPLLSSSLSSSSRRRISTVPKRHITMAKGPDGTLGFYSRRQQLSACAREYVPNP